MNWESEIWLLRESKLKQEGKHYNEICGLVMWAAALQNPAFVMAVFC